MKWYVFMKESFFILSGFLKVFFYFCTKKCWRFLKKYVQCLSLEITPPPPAHNRFQNMTLAKNRTGTWYCPKITGYWNQQHAKIHCIRRSRRTYFQHVSSKIWVMVTVNTNIGLESDRSKVLQSITNKSICNKIYFS